MTESNLTSSAGESAPRAAGRAIGQLRPYPRFKNSGVAWLGQVPAHWEIGRLKASIANVIELTAERQPGDALYIALENVESWTGRVRRADSDVEFTSQVKRFRAGDVLFGKLRPYLAKVTRPTSDGLCVGEFLVLRPHCTAVTSTYLEQFLRSKPVIDAVNSSTFGAKMPRADWQFVGGMPIAIPPVREQAAIARFLNHADRRVWRYIRGKQNLIKLLEEQKQAIIYRAVTRGLDSNVRLKPSSLQWIRDLPEHWAIGRVAAYFRERKETGRPELPILVVSIGSGVTVSREIVQDGRPKRLIADRALYKVAREGDIAYNMMRMWQGAVGVVPVDGLVSPAYVVAEPAQAANSSYFALLFRTNACMGDVATRSRGIVDDRNRLYWDGFKDLRIPLPPRQEQDAIVNWIRTRTHTIETSTQRIVREVQLLREYRTRLIADVVSGKLDVWDAAASLPEDVEDVDWLCEPEVETSADDIDEGHTDEVPEVIGP